MLLANVSVGNKIGIDDALVLVFKLIIRLNVRDIQKHSLKKDLNTVENLWKSFEIPIEL